MNSKHKKLSLKGLNRLNLEQYHEKKKTPMVIVLDNIRSMSNIGSVFRTSDAFLIEEIHLCGITSCPPNKEIHKTALGATESVKWKYFENTLESIQYLKENSFQIISVEQAENSLMLNDYSANNNQKTAFVFGNEVKGVAQEIIDNSDFCLEIPQYGTKHSLNISISAGIVIWHAFNSMNT